jgi:hypothetical protein
VKLYVDLSGKQVTVSKEPLCRWSTSHHFAPEQPLRGL